MIRITHIRKRNGALAVFEPEKITLSIERALKDAKADLKLGKKLGKNVIDILEKHFSKELPPTFKDIRDVIDEVLRKRKFVTTAEAYAKHKQEEKKMIGFSTYHGVRDDIGLTPNALTVLANRYLLRNDEGTIIETPARLFHRVAKAVAQVDGTYKKVSVIKTEEDFYNMLSKLEFLPNTPTLMNAGTPLGQLSACFVLPVEDSLHGIFGTLEKMAIIHQSGGGTGFTFSKLRPKGDLVKSTKGVASGPISFMSIYDTTTRVIKQGGKRRGANMAVLNCDHPDILEFVKCKTTDKNFMTNFNISVAATDAFMDSILKKKEFSLVNPRTGKETGKLNAAEIFDNIAQSAWESGDPGMIFIDEINRQNPTPQAGKIESTNPCGEQPLLANESCNLGSLNLKKMFGKNKKFDWEKLKKTVRLAIHFLDNVIDANKYPFPEIEQITKANRKIGLGVMGFAETLIKLGTPYNSDKAIEFADKLMKFIKTEAHKKSQELGAERGNFPNFEKSIHSKKYKTMRNSTVTTIAPTGTISIIAGANAGIEPLFAVAYIKEVLDGQRLLEVSPLFEDIAKQRGFYNKSLMMKVAKQGSIQNIKEIPKDVKKLFVTSFDISPEFHVKIQVAFQKHTDNAVSKTVNLPFKATVEDVKKVYLLAHKLKCKGITVYRTGSKPQQVLYFAKPEEILTAQEEYSGRCISTKCTD
ncbi:MAG: adenosylcobalamin-dependent ribonucleoside-diphosphate reductase [Candidatus Aenigmarchaeota archaeon]|nr:adenosylcobalamin-dependent ribonucleoside-diphosphate reductase [Candidatus Aenigmarchaeota archaeon]